MYTKIKAIKSKIKPKDRQKTAVFIVASDIIKKTKGGPKGKMSAGKPPPFRTKTSKRSIICITTKQTRSFRIEEAIL